MNSFLCSDWSRNTSSGAIITCLEVIITSGVINNSLELFCLNWKQISFLLGKFSPVLFSKGRRMFVRAHVCHFLSVKSICKIMWSARVAVHWRTTSRNKINKNIWQSILRFSLIFSCVIILKQLFVSGEVNIG